MKFPSFKLRNWFIALCIAAIGVTAITLVAVTHRAEIIPVISSINTQQITVAELQQGKIAPALFVDVRSPQEYAEDRIANSILVPLPEIEAGPGIKKVQALVEESTEVNQTEPTVVLYCASGHRSNQAYKKLAPTGLKLLSLAGGITAWRKAIPPAEDAGVLAPIIGKNYEL